MENEVLQLIIKKLDALETKQDQNFSIIYNKLDKIEKRLDSIENKIGNVPSTYETHEKLLGKAIIDIEHLKRVVFNQ